MDIHQGIRATSDHERILFGAVREPLAATCTDGTAAPARRITTAISLCPLMP